MGSARAILPRSEDSPSGDPTGALGLLRAGSAHNLSARQRQRWALLQTRAQTEHGPAAGKGCPENAAPEPHFSGSGQKLSMLLDQGPKGLSATKLVI